jgi:hypothetical protein
MSDIERRVRFLESRTWYLSRRADQQQLREERVRLRMQSRAGTTVDNGGPSTDPITCCGIIQATPTVNLSVVCGDGVTRASTLTRRNNRLFYAFDCAGVAAPPLYLTGYWHSSTITNLWGVGANGTFVMWCVSGDGGTVGGGDGIRFFDGWPRGNASTANGAIIYNAITLGGFVYDRGNHGSVNLHTCSGPSEIWPASARPALIGTCNLGTGAFSYSATSLIITATVTN